MMSGMQKGNIFHFEYVYEESGQIGENFKKTRAIPMLRVPRFSGKGITAVLIFLHVALQCLYSGRR